MRAAGLDIRRALRALPDVTRIAAELGRAVQGDAEAVYWLKTEGWRTGLNVIEDGLGSATAQALHRTPEEYARARRDQVVDGEYRLLDDEPPWRGFLGYLVAARWGVWVIAGPKGEGKTQLALKLARTWSSRHHYRVEGVNIYPEDTLPQLETIALGQLADELTWLGQHLAGEFAPEHDGPVETIGPDGEVVWVDPPESQSAAAERRYRRMKRRIVIVDEASLAVGPHGANRGRQVVRQLMAQARHLEAHVIYVGQMLRQLPLDVLNAEAIFIKRPQGDEWRTDRQDELTIDLWQRASAAFGGLFDSLGRRKPRRPDWWHPEYDELYASSPAWTYVDCRAPRYRGLMPFEMAAAGEG